MDATPCSWTALQIGRMKVCIIATILLALFPGKALQAQVKEHPVPRVVENDGRYALFVDGAPDRKDEGLYHRNHSVGFVSWESIAGTGEGTSRSSRRRERWTLRPVRGRRSLLDTGRAVEQLQRLADHAPQGVVRHRVPSCQHARNSDLLGAVRAEAGTVRLLASGHRPRSGPRASRPSGAALVRHLEERQPALHARMDEARFPTLLPRDEQERRVY